MLVCRFPEDVGVPTNHVAVNEKIVTVYVKCTYVGFMNEQFIDDAWNSNVKAEGKLSSYH
jgi:hypothetical protein